MSEEEKKQKEINEALEFIAEILASQIERGLYINLVRKNVEDRKNKGDPERST